MPMKNHWEICYKNISLQYEVLSAVEHMNLTQLKIALDFWQKYSCCLGTGGNGNHHEFMCHFKQSKFSEQSQHLICICLQAKDGVGIGPLALTVIIHLLLTALGFKNTACLIWWTGSPLPGAVTKKYNGLQERLIRFLSRRGIKSV